MLLPNHTKKRKLLALLTKLSVKGDGHIRQGFTKEVNWCTAVIEDIHISVMESVGLIAALVGLVFSTFIMIPYTNDSC